MYQDVNLGKKKITPKVSVVITTYNRPKLLECAISSVFAQTYRNWDLHVVDDASSNETRCVVESLTANWKNAHYWRHNKKKGLSAARNTGIAVSSGEFITFLDDDDKWKPQSLEKRINLLNKLRTEQCKKVGVVYCGCEINIVPENRITYNMPKIKGDIRDNICKYGLSTIPSSCLFPREVLEHIGGFDETLCSSVDHDIWMNLAAHGYHAFTVDEPLVTVFHLKRTKTMSTDTHPRIKGVEQYLTKWRPTFEMWFGRSKATKYVQRYRTRVLGDLAGVKLSEGCFRQWWKLIRHIGNKNHWSPVEVALLSQLMGRNTLRKCTPPKIVDIYQRIKHKQMILGKL